MPISNPTPVLSQHFNNPEDRAVLVGQYWALRNSGQHQLKLSKFIAESAMTQRQKARALNLAEKVERLPQPDQMAIMFEIIETAREIDGVYEEGAD